MFSERRRRWHPFLALALLGACAASPTGSTTVATLDTSPSTIGSTPGSSSTGAGGTTSAPNCRVLREQPFVAGEKLMPVAIDAGIYNLDTEAISLQPLSMKLMEGGTVFAAGDDVYVLEGLITTDATLTNITDGTEVDLSPLSGRVVAQYGAGLSNGVAVLVTLEDVEFADGPGQVNRVTGFDLSTGTSRWSWDVLSSPLAASYSTEHLMVWGLRTSPSRDRVLLHLGGDESTAVLVAVLDEKGEPLLEPSWGSHPTGEPPFVATDDRSVPPFTAVNAGWFDDHHWLYDDGQALHLVNVETLESVVLSADRLGLSGYLVAVGDGEHVLTLDEGTVTLASAREPSDRSLLADGCTFLLTEQSAPAVTVVARL